MVCACACGSSNSLDANVALSRPIRSFNGSFVSLRTACSDFMAHQQGAVQLAWHCRCEPVARLVARGHDEGAQGASACGRCQNRCAPLAPQALETGDFGIVVPIVFISLCMVLHRPGGLCSDGGYHFGGFPVWKNPPLGSYCRSVSSAVQTAPTHGKAMTLCVWCSLPTHPLRVPS